MQITQIYTVHEDLHQHQGISQATKLPAELKISQIYIVRCYKSPLKSSNPNRPVTLECRQISCNTHAKIELFAQSQTCRLKIITHLWYFSVEHPLAYASNIDPLKLLKRGK